MCETVPAKDCNIETVTRSKPLKETICRTEKKNKCETVIKKVPVNECKTVTNNECKIVDKPDTKYIQVNTVILLFRIELIFLV